LTHAQESAGLYDMYIRRLVLSKPVFAHERRQAQSCQRLAVQGVD